MKKYLNTVAISSLLAAPAFAGNLQEPSVEPIIATPVQVQPISDWTGFYLGAQLGYGDAWTSPVGVALDGGFAGVHAGYLHDFGDFVLGGELDYDRSDISQNLGGTELKIDKVARLKLIGGYDLGKGLVYATAGVFNGNLKVSEPGFSESDDDNGWVLGGGYKHKFSENWIGGVEALHHKISDLGGELDGLDLKATTISARISYKF
ncbi:outer membrane protein [Pontibaca salina]|uniref:Porin family protein n=1 Tax=Pontibaca salina TaxID=2795731 RepID=A0A934HHL6_9RHOB|nr:porin family protein [Pontibaca salina]MBI6628308.1 porin family protein [Pontibaca salina]